MTASASASDARKVATARWSAAERLSTHSGLSKADGNSSSHAVALDISRSIVGSALKTSS